MNDKIQISREAFTVIEISRMRKQHYFQALREISQIFLHISKYYSVNICHVERPVISQYHEAKRTESIEASEA